MRIIVNWSMLLKDAIEVGKGRQRHRVCALNNSRVMLAPVTIGPVAFWGCRDPKDGTVKTEQ